METSWNKAVELCKNLNFAGYNDWRLPTIQELQTIQNYKLQNIELTIFDNLLSNRYWSSTQYQNHFDSAWFICMKTCFMDFNYKAVKSYILPVRNGKFDDSGLLIINKLKKNQSLFTDNGDGTITDNRTRLIWLKDANFNFEE